MPALWSNIIISNSTHDKPVSVKAPPSTSTPPTTPSTPTIPDKRDPAIVALEGCFEKATDLEVWLHCIGGPRVRNIPDIADDLADHVIVVCLDCEHWSTNTDETTEVGIATFARQDILPIAATQDFGDHGEHLMEQIRFYLFRTIETSHLPNQNPDSRGVEGNRFGKGRFVTFAEARQILTDLFVKPIKNPKGLKGNHPIVVLGHDVGHDKNNLKSKAIAFDMDPIGTVVRYIDTQMMTRDKGYWMMPRNEQIGLRRLVEELGFEHSDPHTAANDAGRTIMCAFQIALGGDRWKRGCRKSLLQVADDLEYHSVATFDDSLGGVDKYCWKCGTAGHMKADCTATDLHCDECEENGCYVKPGDEHITLHCMCIANEEARIRRANDAIARALKKPKVKDPSRGMSSSRARFMARGGGLHPPSGPVSHFGGTPHYTLPHHGPPGGRGYVPPSSGGNPSRGFGGRGQGGYENVSWGRGRGRGGSQLPQGGRGSFAGTFHSA
ncbi:hypothetical protein ACET3X_003548 [Alternaria dauci]|uniref:CCHC-type domain-containing protein n=1 Tax=Alternaria dauci TaxID=48095 RepID=A0ABR3USS4_9PLEO